MTTAIRAKDDLGIRRHNYEVADKDILDKRFTLIVNE